MESSSEFHLFKSSIGNHLFVVDGSRIYDVEKKHGILQNDDLSVFSNIMSSTSRYIDKKPLAPLNLSSISLNVSQSCNMSCG